MAALGRSGTVLAVAAMAFVGCASQEGSGRNPVSGTGGDAETGGAGGSGPAPVTGGSGGKPVDASAPATGGAVGTGGSPVEPDAGVGGTGGSGPPPDAGPTGPEIDPPIGPMNFGGVGEQPLVPLTYTAQPVPPIVTMDCPGDPTAGYTEYKDSFVIQRPRNLAAADRFKYENGIYTTWIFPNDQPHKPNNTTMPRTETRFSDLGTGEHIMSLDVMVDSGSNGTVIHQFKSAGTKGGNIGTYIEHDGGTMRDRAGTVATGVAGKWVNLKIAFNIPTGVGRIWLNNCLKVTTQKEKNALWYFKFGNYHCDNAPKCQAHFKNIHLYQKGSTDKFNVKSPIP